jgi:hypothetical protein
VTLPGEGTVYTPPIAVNASAEAVRTALMAIPGVGQGDVQVTSAGFDFTVTLTDGSVVGVDLHDARTVDQA